MSTKDLKALTSLSNFKIKYAFLGAFTATAVLLGWFAYWILNDVFVWHHPFLYNIVNFVAVCALLVIENLLVLSMIALRYSRVARVKKFLGGHDDQLEATTLDAKRSIEDLKDEIRRLQNLLREEFAREKQ